MLASKGFHQLSIGEFWLKPVRIRWNGRHRCIDRCDVVARKRHFKRRKIVIQLLDLGSAKDDARHCGPRE